MPINCALLRTRLKMEINRSLKAWIDDQFIESVRGFSPGKYLAQIVNKTNHHNIEAS